MGIEPTTFLGPGGPPHAAPGSVAYVRMIASAVLPDVLPVRVDSRGLPGALRRSSRWLGLRWALEYGRGILGNAEGRAPLDCVSDHPMSAASEALP